MNVYFSNATQTTLFTMRDQIGDFLTVQQKKVAFIAIVIFSTLVTAYMCFCRFRATKVQLENPKKDVNSLLQTKLDNLLQPTKAEMSSKVQSVKEIESDKSVQLENPKGVENLKEELDRLLQPMKAEMLSKIKLVKDIDKDIESGKFFILFRAEDQDIIVWSEYVLKEKEKFDPQSLSEEIDKMIVDVKASLSVEGALSPEEALSLEGASNLEILWCCFLKDKDSNFWHLQDDANHKILKQNIIDHFGDQSLMNGFRVIDDQLEFLPPELLRTCTIPAQERLDNLLQITKVDMLSKIQSVKKIENEIESGKFFILFFAQDQDLSVLSEYVLNEKGKFDPQSLSEEIDKMLVYPKESLSFEEISDLKMIWFCFLKDKDSNFWHLPNDTNHKISKQDIINYVKSSLAPWAGPRVIDDQLAFLPPELLTDYAF